MYGGDETTCGRDRLGAHHATRHRHSEDLGSDSAKVPRGSIASRPSIPQILPVQIAGEVKDFNPEDFIERKEIKKMDIFIQYALGAGSMAVEHARTEDH